MKVYMASVTHTSGINLYAGGSKEELLAKLAAYVREQPADDWPKGVKPEGELSDQDAVDLYFTENIYDFLDEDNSEIAAPAGVPHFAVDLDDQPGASL